MSNRMSGKNFAVLMKRWFFVPWQISVVLSVEIFVMMRWIAPVLLNTPAMSAISYKLVNFAPVISAIFLIYAAVSYILSRFGSFAPVPEVDQSAELPISKNTTQPTEWSIELLRSLEWQKFEMLFVEYFQMLGKRVETVFHTADGGIDARIYPRDSNTLEYTVQCKAGNNIVGIKPIFELYGVMAHESAGKGIYLTASTFTADAKQFAEEHKEKIFLIDGQRFINMISKLPEDKKTKLLTLAIEGKPALQE